MSARVLELNPRACSDCEWVAFAGSDLFCLTWHQQVYEHDAKTCDAYERNGASA